MKSPNWAEQMGTALSGSVPRQVGAIPVIYPLLEALGVRQTINSLGKSGAKIDLGHVPHVVQLANKKIDDLRRAMVREAAETESPPRARRLHE